MIFLIYAEYSVLSVIHINLTCTEVPLLIKKKNLSM